jgi:hypothetical protein
MLLTLLLCYLRQQEQAGAGFVALSLELNLH